MAAKRRVFGLLLTAALLTGCGGASDPNPAIPASTTHSPSAPAPPPTRWKPDLRCTDYLLATVRGTSERLDSETSLLTPIAEQIAQSEPGRTSRIDVPYPATAANLHTTPDGADFGATADQGVTMLVGLLNQTATTCPEQRTVLMGYSQGALIVGDTLLAPSLRRAGEATGPLSKAAAEHVTAVVLYGDPRFVGTDTFNAGRYDHHLDGWGGPRRPGELNAFASRLRSFCVADDFVCQAGGQFQPHLSYYGNGMPADGTHFILGLLK
jgi:hypothetical protein